MGSVSLVPGRGLGTRLTPVEQRSVYLYWIDNNLQLLHVYPHRPGHEEYVWYPVRGSGRSASKEEATRGTTPLSRERMNRCGSARIIYK